MNPRTIRFELNGAEQAVTVPAHRRLVDVLRDQCGLFGTKDGCGVGVCGACSVLVDGRLVSACLMLAVSVDGCAVTTVEGLAQNGTPTAVGDAFIEHGGFQCGICTSGQVVAASALLAENPQPSAGDVRAWMMGNLCRCTGYYQIVDAVLAAASERSR